MIVNFTSQDHKSVGPFKKDQMNIKTDFEVALEDYYQLSIKQSLLISKPIWNISLIHSIISYHAPIFHGYKDPDIVIFVRFYHENLDALSAMIASVGASIQSTPIQNVVIVGILTDLTNRRNITERLVELSNISRDAKVRFSLFQIPDFVFASFEKFLQQNLCTSEQQAAMLLQYSPYQINRFCGVNSPLHYLLNDLGLFVLMEECKSNPWVIVTNADNTYDSEYFNLLSKVTFKEGKLIELFYSNMLLKGYTFDVELQLEKIDLGAGAVRLNFLKLHGEN